MIIDITDNKAVCTDLQGNLRHEINLVGASMRRGFSTNELIIENGVARYDIFCVNCTINGTTYNGINDVMSALDPFIISEAAANAANADTYGIEGIVDVSEVSGTHTLSGENSAYNSDVVGGSQGRTEWELERQNETVDLLGTTQPINITPNANVTVNGLDVEKSNTGNSWNSSFYSGQSFDPTVEDFAVSWLVEATAGTIREMGGLDNDPDQNNSYTSLEYAIYQVNNVFYTAVYENGVSIITGSGSVPLQVGDRIGVKCVGGVVSYFILRAGVETVVYRSLKKATAPLYFKGAFNRGSTSSGHSSIGNVEWHVAKKTVNTSVKVAGDSGATITPEDVEALETLGLIVVPSSKYSEIEYTLNPSPKYVIGGTPTPLNYNYKYLVASVPVNGSVNF